MLVLGIETATDAGSVALYDATADALLAEAGYAGARQHGRRLVQHAKDMLQRAERRPEALDLVAVSVGPGSFTGLRIGAAAANAIGQSLAKPVVGVGTTRVLAEQLPFADKVLVVLAARAGEVYVAGYVRESPGGAAAETLPPQLVAIEALASAVAPAWHRMEGGGPLAVTGDAARHVAERLREQLGAEVLLAPGPLRLPRAGTVALLGAAAAKLSPPPADFRPVLPVYLGTPRFRTVDDTLRAAER